MNIDELQERTLRLLGRERMEKLRCARVLVLGVGGVGAFAAEYLARAGVGELRLFDGDEVALSNFNRQLPAVLPELGRPKAEVLARRFGQVNPYGKFVPEVRFLKPEDADALAASGFDCAVDAIDDVPAKCAFLAACVKGGRPVVSSMGAGGKLDPAQVRTADIAKTFGCPLARAVRKNLRELGVTRGIPCVFSPEERAGEADRAVGTISYLPAVFGAFCAAAALKMIAEA